MSARACATGGHVAWSRSVRASTTVAAHMLAAGSDPSRLPAPLLIADKLNNRLLIVDPHGRTLWQFPRPGDLLPGQTFHIPDDAFFTPDGRQIVATQEDDFVVSLIDIKRHRIVWRYGVPGQPGSGPDHLHNPDDAMVLRDSSVVAADIKNCRLVRIVVGRHEPAWTLGQPGACRHAPPFHWGSPNGVFPLPGGDFLVTEINGDWVDEIDRSGRVLWSTHPPGVAYPSDSSRIGPNRYLTVDYAAHGQVVEFDRAGHLLWRYAPTDVPLDHPSLALGLPGGDVIVNDDRNHRVIIVDPRTNRIVWQYGHTRVSGSAPGYLDNPDGMDLQPPLSYADRYQR